MKQLLLGPGSGRTEVADVPTPGPHPGRLLIRTRSSLISAGTERAVIGFTRKNLIQKAKARPDLFKKVVAKAQSDGVLSALEAARTRLAQPLPLGYSASGVVLDVGAGVAGFSVGDRVACAGAGYAVHAEVASVPQNLVTRVPDGVTFETAAFATVGAIGLHGLRLGRPQLGEAVAVIGLGLIGLLAVQMAKAAGCSVLGFDPDPRRTALALELGADRALAIDADMDAKSLALQATAGPGVDLTLVCASTPGSGPITLAGEVSRNRGRVVAVGDVGMDIPRRTYFQKELDFRVSRSYGPGRYDPSYEEHGIDYPLGYVRWTEGRNLEAVLDLARTGKLRTEPLVTHRMPIHEGPRAYELISDPDGDPVLAVILVYDHDPLDSSRPDPALARSVSLSAPDKPGGSMGVGVLGAGLFASNIFLPALTGITGVHIVGIASSRGTSSKQAAARHKASYATTDPNRVILDPEVDVVAILTRHDLHAQQVCLALDAGKHVYCEKPLCLTSQELEAVEESLRNAPGLLTVGFNRRFAPFSQEMKAFFHVVEDPLSIHCRVNAGNLPLEHWLWDRLVGGGPLIGEGCHFVDFMSFLTDALPTRVSTIAPPAAGQGGEENVQVSVEFSDGSIGSLQYVTGGDKALGKERFEVFAGGRAAFLDDFRTLGLAQGGRKRIRRHRLKQNKGHAEAWMAFMDAIRCGGPSTIPFESLKATTRATFAVEQARREGGPVEVSEALRIQPSPDERA